MLIETATFAFVAGNSEGIMNFKVGDRVAYFEDAEVFGYIRNVDFYCESYEVKWDGFPSHNVFYYKEYELILIIPIMEIWQKCLNEL